MTDKPTHDAGDLFSRVLRGILRPLVRALIARGITAPMFYRMTKRIYVEVAEASFELDGKRQTDSRVSLLTGVHRRDVREYRRSVVGDGHALENRVNVLTSILGKWMASDATTGPEGRPLPLPRSGDALSFDGLVSSISKDVRPRTVLDEMVRQGLVEIDPDGQIHLKAEGFVGPEDLDQRVFFFGENVGDHIAAATDNLLAEEPRFLERAVFYNRLSTESVNALEQAARTGGMELLSDLNRMAHDRQAGDVATGTGDERFRFGIFFYRTTEGAADAGTAGEHDDQT